jgi:hypothetical protein
MQRATFPRASLSLELISRKRLRGARYLRGELQPTWLLLLLLLLLLCVGGGGGGGAYR